MSGIFATVNLNGQPIEPEFLQRMTEKLSYLGADARQTWLKGSVGLGHTLFRTTDESVRERQPCTFDGQVYLTADVRLDARDQLIPRLQANGCPVSDGAPDGELILHAYQVWGENCLPYLLGDFAFVLWDGAKQRLWCARDRFGMRRLYWARVRNSLFLSNSLCLLRDCPGVTARLNEQAIGDFLLFGSHTWLDKSATAFADIQRLPPAHLLHWEGAEVKIQRYWDIPLDVPLLRYRREEDYLNHFREIFTAAVKDRMRTDKIVIAMSGGMDSTSIAATACEIARKQSFPVQIQAFTAVYDRIHPDEERYYAGLVADKLGLPIHYFACDDYQLFHPPVRTPEPIEDYTPAMRGDVERSVANFGRVRLSGRSADNLLSYSPFKPLFGELNPLWLLLQAWRLRQYFGKMPSLGTGFIAKLWGKKAQSTNNEPSFGYPCWLNPEFEARLNLKARWQEYWNWQPATIHSRHPEAHKWLVFPDWAVGTDYYPNELTVTPAEERDPFLDLRLVEFILSLPPFPWLYQKFLLRRAMENQLPEPVIRRSKTVLGKVYEALLQQSNTEWVDHWQATPIILNYIDLKTLPPVTGKQAANKETYINLRPLILNLWLEN